MAFGGAARVSVLALWRNRTRSMLTVLGILIGVASVVMVTALSTAASDLIGSQIDQFGTNALFVVPKRVQQGGRRTNPRLTENDVRAIQEGAVSVQLASPYLDAMGQVVVGEKNASTKLIGVKLPYFEIRKFAVGKGSLWSESDETLKTRVCVIGSAVATKLFGEEDPVGRTIRIRRFPFRVLGVLTEKNNRSFSDDEDDRILMPIGTFRGRISPTPPGQAGMIMISATAAETTERAAQQITSLMRTRHRLGPNEEDDFRVISQDDFRRMEQAIAGVLTALLFAVATVSLLVGGVGVMNIMLVSVSERTREIGIRMSLGAREQEILVQFLVEAIVLSALGGALGIVAGILGALGIGFALDWRVVPNFPALAVALFVSGGIGLLFGFLPARRAARLDPIDALRTE